MGTKSDSKISKNLSFPNVSPSYRGLPLVVIGNPGIRQKAGPPIKAFGGDSSKGLYRILDANFNRVKEGLRVCEDICRYVRDEKNLTRGFKDVRHDLTRAVEGLGILKALAARNIGRDVGRATTFSESVRKDIGAVFWANSQRVKESLRVLEEIAKLIEVKSAQRLKHLRYTVYALEQKALKKF